MNKLYHNDIENTLIKHLLKRNWDFTIAFLKQTFNSNDVCINYIKNNSYTKKYKIDPAVPLQEQAISLFLKNLKHRLEYYNDNLIMEDLQRILG